MSHTPKQLDAEHEFRKLVENHQGPLYAFVLSLMGDPHAAKDLLQEVNLILWRKATDFTLGTNFRAWAFQIARLQVFTWRRKMGKESTRLVFDDDLIANLAEEADEIDDRYAERSRALHHCLAKLPERQREAILKRYFRGHPVSRIAADWQREPNAISQLLHRSRQSLLRCLAQSLK